jgi:azurin
MFSSEYDMPQPSYRLTRGQGVLTAVFFATFLWVTVPTAASASECNITVQTDDALRFIPSHITVPAACKDFTVSLTHTGHLPPLAMSHNWVLTKKSDLDGVARTGMLAGADANHVDQTDKRVIAYTKLIGTGETASVTFAVAQLKAGEPYVFLCTFAGHSPIMRGSLSVQ